MDDNFDELTGRYNSSISIPVQEAPGCRPAMGSLENSVPPFDANSTLWPQVGIMNTWINTAQSKFTHFEKLVETQGGIIDTVKKENALLKQEVKELKEHVKKRTKKKTCSPREKLLLGFIRKHYKGKMVREGVVWNFDYDFDHEENIIVKNLLINYMLKTADDLGYVWTSNVIEEKLCIVYKNEKYKDSLSLEQKYHARKNIYQENCEALFAEFKDANRLIDQELMSDEEDLHDQSKKRIAGIKRVRGDEYIAEKELSKNQRTRLPSWAIVPLVERAVLSVQPDNSEQHISPVQPKAPSEQ
ncbi:hypothetical protein INT45_006528 [Circinella minor]|uniref:Uncharacterized protein n=1 Tax=Circinella minor TaxID=1195481 RepID=A0A8H7RNM7_9FUNG|nr:hypothetical protein INT45_006528 [Circinella minor]